MWLNETSTGIIDIDLLLEAKKQVCIDHCGMEPRGYAADCPYVTQGMSTHAISAHE